MFRLGRQVESALMAFNALENCSNPKGLSIAEISSSHGLSKNTLSKVMQSLLADGFLDSSQGTKGGYRLKQPLSEISFYNILNSLGEIKKLSCSTQKACDLSETCDIKSPLQRWEKNFENYLRNTKLSDLLAKDSESEVSLGN